MIAFLTGLKNTVSRTSTGRHVFIRILTAALIFCTAVFAPVAAHAASYDFDSHYLRINIPDDILVMTPDTSAIDPIWEEAGITDPSAKIKEFESMKIIAALCNPSSKQTVNVLGSVSSATAETFTLQGKTPDEVVRYMQDSLAQRDDGSVVIDVSYGGEYSGLPFYKLNLDATVSETPCNIVVYGTVVNARDIEFYQLFNPGTPIDESFLKDMLSGLEFTRLLTYEEYTSEVNASIRNLILFAVIAVAGIVGIVALAAAGRKRSAKRIKRISAALTAFRERQHSENSPDKTPVYTVSSKYDAALFDEFGIFSAWFKPNIGLILSVVLFAALAVLLFTKGYLIFSLVMFILTIVILFLNYNRCEKNKEALCKRYDVKSCPTATFRFYKEYFTVSGLITSGEFVYEQVTSVNTFRSSVYLYLSDTQVLVLRREDLGGTTVKQLKDLINSAKTK